MKRWLMLAALALIAGRLAIELDPTRPKCGPFTLPETCDEMGEDDPNP